MIHTEALAGRRRRFDVSHCSSATFKYRIRSGLPVGVFFLLVSKGFGDGIRPSETGIWREIGL